MPGLPQARVLDALFVVLTLVALLLAIFFAVQPVSHADPAGLPISPGEFQAALESVVRHLLYELC